MTKKALLLVNIGSPNNPSKKAVRRFLSQFLNDPLVIDIPWIFQKILVNLIIIPFRIKNSSQLYKQLWTDKGSPLLIHLNNITEEMQNQTADYECVIGAMRYGNPSIAKAIKHIKSIGCTELIVMPMYPQYAASTTLTTVNKVKKVSEKLSFKGDLFFVNQFYNNKAFINIFADKILSFNPLSYDIVIFSYHGLPLRHIKKSHPHINEESCSCKDAMPEHGKLCYKANCYETTRLLVKECNLPKEQTITVFQSRLSRNWLTPFLDKTLIELAKKGTKKVLIVAPSFVSDCLETTIEIEKECNELFLNLGGEKLTLVPSLNSSKEWADAVLQISKNHKNL